MSDGTHGAPAGGSLSVVENRERILDSVRSAVRHPASAHEPHGAAAHPYPTDPDPRSRTGRSRDELCAEFVAEVERLGKYQDQQFGTAWRVKSLEEARERVRAVLGRPDITKVAAIRGPCTSTIITADLHAGVDFTWCSLPDRAGHALADCDLGITECECLVAHTGSILVTTGGAQSRAVSLLPPVHLVIADISQLVPDVPDAIDRVIGAADFPHLPAAYTFITGASRTSDIEKMLVVPAHGPREVYTIILDLD